MELLPVADHTMSANEEVNETAMTASNGEGTTEEQSSAKGCESTSIEGKTTDPPKEEPSAQESTAEEPPAQEPTAKEPTAQEPTAEGPTAEDNEEFESAPENWNDFVVLDEANITDNEAEEDEAEEPKSDDDDGKQWDCPVHRLGPRTYTMSQLQPTELDPRCKPNFPLAGYWPVYVGNFHMSKRGSDYNCMFAVHKYFASKGLPAFMVFRLKDAFYENYQKRVGLYDMLVYFINKKDANRAINWCHGDLYWGHKLKVYDGRAATIAAKYGKSKFFKIKHLIAEDKLETETSLEEYMRQYGQVIFLSKQSLNYVYVHLNHHPNRNVSIMQDPRLVATPVTTPVRKQRFIEEEVMDLLTQEIAENPKFLRSRLRYMYLKFIMHGVIPEMNTPWLKKETKYVSRGGAHSQANANRHYAKEVIPQKRRYDDYNHGNGASQPRSRRQLLNEARQLEEQLRAVQSKINSRIATSAKLPYKKKPIPLETANADETMPKRQKTEAQLMRQRIRGSRRRRAPRFDTMAPELDDVL